MWKKRGNEKSIKAVIQRNIKDFSLNSKKQYKMDKIKEFINVLQWAENDNIPITVVTDYDVDGVCSAAILYTILSTFNIKFKIRIPRRMSEGFGLNTKIVDEINEGILITADNGIAAIEAINKAKQKGLHVIVTDHHLPNVDTETNDIILPDADLIINPHAIPNSSDFEDYCGAGIVYKIAEQILTDDKKLNICKVYAALATIADVVPLVEENHTIVKTGLDIMNNNKEELTLGMQELINIANINGKIDEETIGYKFGPMINAPGRLKDNGAIDSLTLLVTNNEKTAKEYAVLINNQNELRKQKVANAIELVSEQLQNKEIPPILFIKQDNIDEGIVGIIAGRLTEIYQRPCILVTPVEDNILKGSARSCNNIHLKELLDNVQNETNGFIKYGGHADAAGLSLKESDFNIVNKSLISNVPEITSTDEDILYYDLEIEAEDIPILIDEVVNYAPYGNTNEQIIFKIKNYIPDNCSLFNENQGIRFKNEYATALSFDGAQKYSAELNSPSNIDIIGTISLNYYKEWVSNQIKIIDFDIPYKASSTKTELENLILTKANEYSKLIKEEK